MGRRIIGLGFCGIAAFLFGIRYLGIVFSQVVEGRILLLILSILSLLIGIVYLALGERE